MTRLAVTDGRSERAAEEPALETDETLNSPDALRAAAALDPAQLAAQVQRQGGIFHSMPAASGGGLTYSADFPVRAVEPTSLRTDMQLPSLRDAFVMVVDDQSEAREMLAEILRANGARVAEHKDGEQALAAFAALPVEHWPQVLICDLSLGDIDGYEVVGRIRAMEAERGAALAHRLPAIALSGHVSQESRLRSLLAGFQVHLSKPVDPNELLATVGSLIPALPRPPRDSGTSYTHE